MSSHVACPRRISQVVDRRLYYASVHPLREEVVDVLARVAVSPHEVFESAAALVHLIPRQVLLPPGRALIGAPQLLDLAHRVSDWPALVKLVALLG